MVKPMSGLRILVVEDEFLIAMVLSDMIEDAGGEVVGPVARVSAARELIAREDVDGAFLDVLLGDEDSLPIAEELVARDTPVVMVTGCARDALPDALAKLPLLPKPVTQTALIGAVNKYIRCTQ